MIYSSKNLAFTLAEVLITLGIIGIVAAMTLPALTAKYQQHVLYSQFKKSYTNFQTAINSVNSENGVAYECYAFMSNGWNTSVTECEEFWTKVLSKYKILKECGFHNRSACTREDILPTYKTKAEVLAAGGSTNEAYPACIFPIGEQTGYYLSDGSLLYVYNYPNYNGNSITFGLDVNGKKGPNKWGYDFFFLTLYRKNIKSMTVGLTGICELIEKGGHTAEEMMQK